jgi:hypothetical protein
VPKKFGSLGASRSSLCGQTGTFERRPGAQYAEQGERDLAGKPMQCILRSWAAAATPNM